MNRCMYEHACTNTYLDLPVKEHVRTKWGDILKLIQEQTETQGLHAVFSEWSVHCDLTTNQMQVSTITPPSHHRPISSYCQCQYTHCSKKTMGFLTNREASRCSLFYSVLNVKEKLSKNFLGDFLRAERSIKFP